jgi:hypothetical protein
LTECATENPQPPLREVFVGKHSTVWAGLSPLLVGQGLVVQAIGHADISSFSFGPLDRIWVLAYSRHAAQNTGLIQALARTPARALVLVSSSSAIVAGVTRCYVYPHLKRQAEVDALAVPHATVLTLGMMYADPAQLPAGACVATSYRDLAAFVARPDWPDGAGRRKHLFGVVQRPFPGALQRRAQQAYGAVLRACGPWPCLLRPLDLLLRACGVRWYGYVYLSNKLWTSTTL